MARSVRVTVCIGLRSMKPRCTSRTFLLLHAQPSSADSPFPIASRRPPNSTKNRYEDMMRTSYVVDFFTKHPRIVLPLLGTVVFVLCFDCSRFPNVRSVILFLLAQNCFLRPVIVNMMSLL